MGTRGGYLHSVGVLKAIFLPQGVAPSTTHPPFLPPGVEKSFLAWFLKRAPGHYYTQTAVARKQPTTTELRAHENGTRRHTTLQERYAYAYVCVRVSLQTPYN